MQAKEAFMKSKVVVKPSLDTPVQLDTLLFCGEYFVWLQHMAGKLQSR
jgi:hypothetical protein